MTPARAKEANGANEASSEAKRAWVGDRASERGVGFARGAFENLWMNSRT